MLPLGATNQVAPFAEAGRRGLGFEITASIIRTSGPGESDGSLASDADTSEKIRSKIPLSHLASHLVPWGKRGGCGQPAPR